MPHGGSLSSSSSGIPEAFSPTSQVSYCSRRSGGDGTHSGRMQKGWDAGRFHFVTVQKVSTAQTAPQPSCHSAVVVSAVLPRRSDAVWRRSDAICWDGKRAWRCAVPVACVQPCATSINMIPINSSILLRQVGDGCDTVRRVHYGIVLDFLLLYIRRLP